MIDQTTPTVGMLLSENAGRDAIHFALAPVYAGQHLNPNDDIGLLRDGRVGTFDNPELVTALLGKADPFLREAIKPNERFWMLLYPNTITSLRHVWTHDAFKVKVPMVTRRVTPIVGE